MQAGRSLVGAWGGERILSACPKALTQAAAVKRKRLAPGVAYLGKAGVLTSKSNSSLDLTDIQNAWSCVAANVVKKAADEYVVHLKAGKPKGEAMERTSQSRFIAAKLHTTGYIFGMFKEAIDEMEDCAETKLLATVCRLYGLWQIEEQQGFFLKCRFKRVLDNSCLRDDRRLP